MDELERQRKTLLYVIKTMNDLVDQGILTGKAFEISKEGLEELGDFEPLPSEISAGMEFLREEGYIA